MDVKFLERIPGTRKRLYQFTAIRFIDEVLRRLPVSHPRGADRNVAEFQSHFHWHLERLDIATRTSDPGPAPEREGRAVPPSSTIRSSMGSSISAASAMTFTCSTRSCASGRITPITIDRTERWMVRPRMNDSSPR
jgi:hypothetical protein